DINGLVDGNGKINDNRLKQFTRLLKVLSLDPKLGLRMADWLDKDDSPRTERSERSDLEPGAPLPPNRRLESIHQLRGVHGLDNKSWHRLSPHIAASQLPLRYKPNTATPAVYAAKQSKPLGSLSSTRSRRPSKGGTSEWFEVDIQVQFNEHHFSMKSTIYRESKQSAVVVSRDLTPSQPHKSRKFEI
ncbi:MAG: general secretion pathway protein GspK, partial [Flavobacteriaceae bacterium]